MLLVECERRLDDPPLIAGDRFLADLFSIPTTDLDNLVIKRVDPDEGETTCTRAKSMHLFVIPPDFQEKLRKNEKPAITILGREGDETSKVAVRRVGGIIKRWQQKLKEVRFARQGLPADFDESIKVVDPQESKSLVVKTADELRDQLVKFFPFLLVMWTMAGALHPAIDLTAGEKERGTMETLLISPAERSEIVAGKFLAVWLFSYVSALCNLFWMGGSALALSYIMANPIMSLGGLAWASLFAIPLSRVVQRAGDRPRRVCPQQQGRAILSCAAILAGHAAMPVEHDAGIENLAAVERRADHRTDFDAATPHGGVGRTGADRLWRRRVSLAGGVRDAKPMVGGIAISPGERAVSGGAAA